MNPSWDHFLDDFGRVLGVENDANKDRKHVGTKSLKLVQNGTTWGPTWDPRDEFIFGFSPLGAQYVSFSCFCCFLLFLVAFLGHLGTILGPTCGNFGTILRPFCAIVGPMSSSTSLSCLSSLF